MGRITHYLDRTFYPDSHRWDDRLFRERILAHVGPQSTVLDLGAGAGIVPEMNFRGVVGKVCGVDLDARVIDNPYLDEAHHSDGAAIPYPDETFDVVFADNVVEHLAEPEKIFIEVCRVLKPGGCLLFKTPNKTHYMPTIAQLTPHRFHGFVNRQRGRKEIDTFPTLYRANTASRVTSLARQCGFSSCTVERIEGRPEYLRLNPLLYLGGIVYERLVNASEVFAPLRILLVAQCRKPGTAAVAPARQMP